MPQPPFLRPARRPQRRRGASVVEFALVAPVFFLVVLGMIEFGRMAMVQQVLTNAAREGARVGVLDGATTAGVTNKVDDYLASASISGAAVQVSPNPPNAAAYGESVTVTVSISFNDVSWLPTPFFVGGQTLRAESVMRRETAE
ncbi:MAG: TadE/TadG family type IV pilus assembly protein [Planctomycetota bacterium]